MRNAKASNATLFLTITVPSSFYPTRFTPAGKVVRNPSYEHALTPRDAAQWLRKEWQRMRARIARGGVTVWGSRLLEPHFDGVPHMHVLMMCRNTDELYVRAAVRQIGVGGRAEFVPSGQERAFFGERPAMGAEQAARVSWSAVWGVRSGPVRFGNWEQLA